MKKIMFVAFILCISFSTMSFAQGLIKFDDISSDEISIFPVVSIGGAFYNSKEKTLMIFPNNFNKKVIYNVGEKRALEIIEEIFNPKRKKTLVLKHGRSSK